MPSFLIRRQFQLWKENQQELLQRALIEAARATAERKGDAIPLIPALQIMKAVKRVELALHLLSETQAFEKYVRMARVSTQTSDYAGHILTGNAVYHYLMWSRWDSITIEFRNESSGRWLTGAWGILQSPPKAYIRDINATAREATVFVARLNDALLQGAEFVHDPAHDLPYDHSKW